MKKITTFLILFFFAFQMNLHAQKEITTVHLYDITNSETIKSYKESVNKVNKLMIEIGYPKNYYTFLTVGESDKSENYKFATIGHWTSDAAYTAIHDNAKYKAWSEENKKNAVFVKDQLYRKLYQVK
jgi:hypothetical protein